MRTACWARAFLAACCSAAIAIPSLCAAPAPGLAEFAAGIQAYGAKDYSGAITHLTLATREAPLLFDYTAYHLASARSLQGDTAGALRELQSLHAGSGKAVLSPLGPKAALLQAQLQLQQHDPGSAIRMLRELYDNLPQPDADLLLAQAYEARGETLQASALYQRVYYLRPATQAAVTAASAMEGLKKHLGKDYPPPAPSMMLSRGDVWLAAKNYSKAKLEFQSLAAQLSGTPKEQAQVRVAAADLLAGDTRSCRAAFEALHFSRDEADAERLYYLAECNRKLNDDAATSGTIDTLVKRYPDSPWRLKALIAVGNRYLVTHDQAHYLPLFTAAYEKFPADAVTAYAHWKVTWDAYLKRAPQARALLQEQIRKYPPDTRTASALYFLGRAAEDNQEMPLAREFYTALWRAFPNYYYGVLAEGRLTKASSIGAEGAAPWLVDVKFPAHPDLAKEVANAATQAHIERARMLLAAGFADMAQAELRFGADHDGQKHLLAVEMAREDTTPALALRHMKGLAADYLSLPLDNASREFWRFLFPLPYKAAVLANAKANGLDPYLLAGLIRQESEFNPAAVSKASAMGLTQLMPGTGRMVAHGEGVAAFSTSMLFQPEVSLRLGAAYLKAQVTTWNGNLEQTLAAYNAGPGRVKEWLAWGQPQDPAEFVENIPFTETREYVQAVLRNADVYRRLYAGRPDDPEVVSEAAPAKPTVPVVSTVHKAKARRKGRSRA